MHLQVVRVGVALLVVVVGDDHLRTGPADGRHETADGLVERGLVEAGRVLVARRVGHARVPVAEHDDLVEADDLGRAGELSGPQVRQQRLLLMGLQAVEGLPGLPEGGVLELALLAAGAAHEHGADALGVVAGQRGRALRGFVVRVGVHCEHAQRDAVEIQFSHVVTLSADPGGLRPGPAGPRPAHDRPTTGGEGSTSGGAAVVAPPTDVGKATDPPTPRGPGSYVPARRLFSTGGTDYMAAHVLRRTLLSLGLAGGLAVTAAVGSGLRGTRRSGQLVGGDGLVERPDRQQQAEGLRLGPPRGGPGR